MNKHLWLRLAACTALSTGWTAAAAAADQADQPSAAPEASPQAAPVGAGTGEILVTARKREERLQDVPMSITAVGGDTLRQRQITNQAELSFRTPNFQQTNGVNVAAFMRGVGSGSNPSFEQAVGTFVDGIYAGRGAQQPYLYFDVERVEVLRGPQVTLYGNSAIAGAVSVVTRKPGNELAADITTKYEFNHEQFQTQGGVTIPVGDKLRLRFAGYYDYLGKGWLQTYRSVQMPGFFREDPQWRNRAGRITADLDVTDSINLDVKYEIWQIQQDGNTLQPTANAGTPTVKEYTFDNVRDYGNGFPQNDQTFDPMRMKSQTLQANLSIETGAGTITSTSSYVWYDWLLNTEADQSPIPLFNFVHQEDFNQFSQELRFTSNTGGKFDYIVGAFYQRDDLNLWANFEGNFASIGVPVPAFARRIRLDQITNNYSGFVEGNYHFTDQLTLNVGLRYMHVDKDASQMSRAWNILTDTPRPDLEVSPGAGRPSPFAMFYGSPHNFDDLSLSEDHWMPQALLQYKFGSHMIFAKFVKGAKAGGFDWAGTDPNKVKFGAEKATSYEAGIKGSFLDNDLTYGLTLFQMDVDDLQVSSFDGALGYIVGNAAKTRSKGVEAEVSWNITPNFRVNGSGGYTDAKYLDYKGAACYVEMRLTWPASAGPCRRDMSGGRMPFTAKWNFAVGAQHTLELPGYSLTTGVNYAWRDRTNVAAITDPGQWERSVGLLDARIALSPEGGEWTFAVYGKNLTNEWYSTYGTEAPSNPLVRLRNTERPRQIGLELGWRF